MSQPTAFLENSTKRLREYKGLAEKAIAQLSDEALLHDADKAGGNSLAVIIKHMRGNMLSRWTNYLTEDGEKPWRQREEEFVHESLTRKRLMQLWEEGWATVFNTLSSLGEEDLGRTIHIRTESMTAMDGIIRQLMHYAYHVGQIILICKQELGDGWQSLSIPKGGTAAFNAAMATQSDSQAH